MWPGQCPCPMSASAAVVSCRGVCRLITLLLPDASLQNNYSTTTPILVVKFAETDTPIVFSSRADLTVRVDSSPLEAALAMALTPPCSWMCVRVCSAQKRPSRRGRSMKQGPGPSLKRLLHVTPLYEFTADEKSLLWRHREILVSVPGVRPALCPVPRHCLTVFLVEPFQALSKLLLCVDWGNRAAVGEAHALLKEWGPLSLHEAMLLLDLRYPDPTVKTTPSVLSDMLNLMHALRLYQVRAFAVRNLEDLSSQDLRLYMLQLVQALRFEHCHDSALARFLLRRALLAPKLIGHTFYWMLKVGHARALCAAASGSPESMVMAWLAWRRRSFMCEMCKSDTACCCSST